MVFFDEWFDVWLKKENVTIMPDPDKEQSMEIKPVVAAK